MRTVLDSLYGHVYDGPMNTQISTRAYKSGDRISSGTVIITCLGPCMGGGTAFEVALGSVLNNQSMGKCTVIGSHLHYFGSSSSVAKELARILCCTTFHNGDI